MWTFNSSTLICDPTLSPGKNSPNITNSNRVLTRKGEGDKDFSWSFSPLLLIFFNFGHLQGKASGQSRTNFFQAKFLFARVLPLVKFLAMLDLVWGSKDQKSSQKRPFHRRWMGTQNFESFQLNNYSCYSHEIYHVYASSWECQSKTS